MTHPQFLTSLTSQDATSEPCLDVFQQELDFIFHTLRRIGARPADVNDLAQEVFLALRRCWGKYDPNRPIRPYLFGIAFRIASAHRRKRKREVAFSVRDTDDTGPRPDEALESKQARAMVLAALERIPLPRRAVLVMHDLDDVAVADVATVLAIPLFTVYSRLRKARREFERAIRRMWKEAGLK